MRAKPARQVEERSSSQDNQGRLQFAFTAIKAVRDVVVVSTQA